MISINKDVEACSIPDPIVLGVVGTYLPRRCGIATFTSDLCNSIRGILNGPGEVFAVAMDDIPKGYDYPSMVRMEIRTQEPADYRMAADYLNLSPANVIVVQHEFGIFGGPAGNYINHLLGALKKPVITTLHTILAKPTPEYRNSFERVLRFSERLVVMSRHGEKMLHEVYKVPQNKIAFIPHGIPDVPFIDPNFHKDEFHIAGRRAILTFGLIGPGKGIELMIQALPKVVENHPDVVYIVLGATHPGVLLHSGEKYRTGLEQMVRDRGVSDNVIFVNKFVELAELCRYIEAADIYVTPYPNQEQSTSGTLAYAIGAGKAVVSTPYWYAQELLADGQGELINFGDHRALSETINRLLADEVERHAMRKRAYLFARNMVWNQVAREYIDLAHHVINHRFEKPVPLILSERINPKSVDLPEINLQHLQTITDRVGLIQHAKDTIPDRQYGYSTDDNGRGLVFLALHWSLYQDRSILPLLNTYLSFVVDAYNEKERRFRNFLSYDLKWSPEFGEDTHARALWGLGALVPEAPNHEILVAASRLFLHALPPVTGFEHPRAIAYALIAIHCYLQKFNGDTQVRQIREHLARRLMERFHTHKAEDWVWFNDVVSYANAKIPHALILAGQWIPDNEMLQMGLECLNWLLKVQTGPDSQLSLIGNHGWWSRGGNKAHFDQQPIDTTTFVQACLEAYHSTHDPVWADHAQRCFEWFLGRNDLNVPLYDEAIGGCRDGLHSTGVNENQGAESTLSWLIALASMYLFKRQVEQGLDKEVLVEVHYPNSKEENIPVAVTAGI
jgi:glycosyltransferase involved in cell wall biosynthesis